MIRKSLFLVILLLLAGVDLKAQAPAIESTTPAQTQTESPQTESPKMSGVLVAATELGEGDRFNDKNVRLENWPSVIIPENAFSDLSQIESKFASIRIQRGLPITSENSRDYRFSIPAGYKVIVIKTRLDGTSGGLIQAGDFVDVICRMHSAKDGEHESGVTVAKQLRVFTEPSAGKNGDSKVLVPLLVTESEGDSILRCHQQGSLKLALTDSDVSFEMESHHSPQKDKLSSRTHTEQVRIAQIRAIARHLDELAAELEELEKFERADSLRSEAQSIRVEVRR